MAYFSTYLLTLKIGFWWKNNLKNQISFWFWKRRVFSIKSIIDMQGCVNVLKILTANKFYLNDRRCQESVFLSQKNAMTYNVILILSPGRVKVLQRFMSTVANICTFNAILIKPSKKILSKGKRMLLISNEHQNLRQIFSTTTSFRNNF